MTYDSAVKSAVNHLPERPSVARTRLVAELVRATESLVLISAAPGSGKTTLVQQWMDVDPRPSAVIRLGIEDNEFVVFLERLVAALSELRPPDAVEMRWFRFPDPPVDELIISALQKAIEARPPSILVLSGAQVLENVACWNLVARLAEMASTRLTIVVVSRVDPPLPLARLRADIRLREIRSPELAFDHQEARALMDMLNVSVADEVLDVLLQRTEGWPTGLSLAGQVLRHEPQAGSLDSLRGDRKDIADYLTSEVIARQPADVVDFLESTCIVDAFSPDLCTALTLMPDAVDLLHVIEHRNLFVSRVDQAGNWYRYHHLFVEMLRTRLEQRQPEVCQELHRRAAVWYEQHDMVGEALRHWLAAGQPRRAGELVVGNWEAEWHRGGISVARRWLDDLDPQQIAENPQLTVAAAWILSMSDDIDRQRRVMLQAEELLESSCLIEPSLAAEILILRARLGRNGVHRMKADAELAKQSKGTETELSGLADCHLGVACMLAGDTDSAIRALEAAARGSAYSASPPSVVVEALGQLSLLHALLGNWIDAERYSAQAMQLVETVDVKDFLPHAASRLACARSRAKLGDEVKAEASRFSQDDLRRLEMFPWAAIQAALTMAATQLDLGNPRAAESWVSKARLKLKDYPDSGILAGIAADLERALQRRLMTEPITSGETKVLRLLPTHLSAESIAARLFVSKNTVRTHVASIYRKLSVDSREAAVDRAYALGLLTDRTGQQNAAPLGQTTRSPRGLWRSTLDQPIRIGSALPLTGFAAADGLEQLRAITLAIEQWNSRGGVHGRPLEHSYVDVGDMSVKTMMSSFSSLIHEHRVHAIVNGYLIWTGQEHDLVADSETPYLHINTSSRSKELYGGSRSKYWMCFQCDPSEMMYAFAFGKFLQFLESMGSYKPRSRSVAVVASSDPYSLTIAQTLPSALRRVGWHVSVFETVQSPVGDWQTVLGNVKRTASDVVFLSDIILEDNVTFTTDFLSNPSRTLLYGQYAPTLREYAEAIGPRAEGTISSAVGGVLPGDKGSEYRRAYARRFGVEPGTCVGGLVFDEVNLLATAVALAGGAEDARRVCDEINGLWMRGTTGVCHFGPDRVAMGYPLDSRDPSVAMPHLFFQIQKGSQRIIYPPPYVEASFALPPWFAV